MWFETFDLSVFIEADETKVRDAWLKSEQLEQWFLATATFVSAASEPREPGQTCAGGDTYWWEWIEGSVETGIIETAGENVIEFSFGENVSVSVEWRYVHDGTLVVLSQKHLMTKEDAMERTYVSCFQGWTFYLTNLKAFLEHGIDLRERAPTRKDHVNV